MFFVNSVYASSVVSQVLFHRNSNAIWYRSCTRNIFKTWEQAASASDISCKQNTITSTGTTNLLTAPASSGGNPGTKAISDFLASPAAQATGVFLPHNWLPNSIGGNYTVDLGGGGGGAGDGWYDRNQGYGGPGAVIIIKES